MARFDWEEANRRQKARQSPRTPKPVRPKMVRSKYVTSCNVCSGAINVQEQVYLRPGIKGVCHVGCNAP